MDTPIEAIELADAVGAIRDGLLTATSRGAGSSLRFELGDIQMEFTVELRRDTQGKGGVKAWVINASAEHSSGYSQTQRVSFTLKPKNSATGTGWDIASETEGDASRFEEG